MFRAREGGGGGGQTTGSTGGYVSYVGGSGGVATGGTTGAATGGTTSASGGATGTGGSDGGINPVLCDYSGTWGTYIRVPVSWPDAPFILLGGTGSLQEWNLTTQQQVGLDVHSSTVPCMIFLPDLQSSFAGGFLWYGIRFPESLFDNGGIPKTDFIMHGGVDANGAFFETDPFAIMIGLTMTNPTTTPWPGTHYLTLADHDDDKNPGVTVIPALDQFYSLPPVDVFQSVHADQVFIAERSVSKLAGRLTNCDEVDSTVEILSVNGLAGIQSSVVGCHLETGTDCDTTQSDFVDGIRPQYTPTGLGTTRSVRMPAGTTCADVRAKFPAF